MEFVRGGWTGRWKRRRLASTGRVFSLLSIYFCFFFSSCALLCDAGNAAVASEPGNSRSGGGTGSPVQLQGQLVAPEGTGGTITTAALEGEGTRRSMVAAGGGRRYLVGPGSYPPRCASKCGACNPCKPVHVPVPPGTPVINEYYPEAWRCKCGGKLYMP